MTASTFVHVALFVSSFFVVGCSGEAADNRSPESDQSESSRSDPSEPEVGRVRQIQGTADLAGLSLPLDPYLPSPEWYDLQDAAWGTLVQRCMEGFGLDYSKHVRTEPTGGPYWPSHLRRYMVIDPDEVAAYGYLPPPQVEDDSSRSNETTSSVPPEVDDVLLGRVETFNGADVPKGGCNDEARRALSPDDPEPVVMNTQTMALDASSYAQSDSRMQEAFRAWSACMADAGFDYGTPMDAVSDEAWSDGSRSEPSSQEIVTAKADVACKAKVDLVGLWYAVDSAYQQQMIEENRAELERYRVQLDDVMRKAEKVLGE